MVAAAVDPLVHLVAAAAEAARADRSGSPSPADTSFRWRTSSQAPVARLGTPRASADPAAVAAAVDPLVHLAEAEAARVDLRGWSSPAGTSCHSHTPSQLLAAPSYTLARSVAEAAVVVAAVLDRSADPSVDRSADL